MTVHVAAHTMEEFREALAANPWLILPVGSTEEHGPHLPLGSDALQAERVAERVARGVGGLVAPTIPYGLCRATRRFPGTVSISYEVVEALVHEVLRGFAEQGVRRFLILSGHAGGAHRTALEQAALRLVEADGGVTVLVLCATDIPLPFLKEAGVGPDGHAGTLETAAMLYLAEPLVRRDRIAPGSRPAMPRFQILAHPERYFPSGVRGDPSRATHALGERVVNHVVAEVVRLLREASNPGPPAVG